MNWMAGMIHKNSKRIKTMFNCPTSQKIKKISSVNTDIEAFLSSENYSYQPHDDWDYWGWKEWLGDQHVFKVSNGRPHKIPFTSIFPHYLKPFLFLSAAKVNSYICFTWIILIEVHTVNHFRSPVKDLSPILWQMKQLQAWQSWDLSKITKLSIWSSG